MKTAPRDIAPGNGAGRRLRSRLNHLPPSVRIECSSCGSTFAPSELEVDHVHAFRLGGHDVDDNLQTLCKPCHYRKSAAERRYARDIDGVIYDHSIARITPSGDEAPAIRDKVSIELNNAIFRLEFAEARLADALRSAPDDVELHKYFESVVDQMTIAVSLCVHPDDDTSIFNTR